MGIILWIVGGIVVLGIVYALFYALCRSFPWIRWVLALALGVGAFFLWGIWWVAILVFFFALGIFVSMTETKTRRGNAIHCSECGNDILDVTYEDDHYLSYRCRKCGHEGGYQLRR